MIVPANRAEIMARSERHVDIAIASWGASALVPPIIQLDFAQKEPTSNVETSLFSLTCGCLV